ncbi:gliding motility-associated C-terminal domain-containing protein [Crocinitomicaceae bacterium]|nr:gliding motility-associated C-terminal domain-containing protein [Crocinitomicaceae bacterium]
MSDKDPIKDLFRDKLQSHEVMPSKAVWSNVSSSLGHSAASASGLGASSILKIAAVVVGVSTVGVVSYLYMNNEDSNSKSNKKIVLQDEVLDEPVSSETISVPQNTDSKEPVKDNVTEIISEGEISDNVIRESQPESFITQEILPVSPSFVNQANLEVQETSDVVESVPEVISELPTTSLEQITPSSQENIAEVAQDAQDEIVSVETPVEDSEISNPFEEVIVLPNIFTPNGDRVNDVFMIEMTEKLEFQIIVLNAKNQTVFKSNDANFEWDGTMLNGEPAPAGNYLYYFSAKDLNGKDVTKSSMLKIQR